MSNPNMKSFSNELLKLSALSGLMQSPIVKKLKWPAAIAAGVGGYELVRAKAKRLIENQQMAEAMRDQMEAQPGE